MTGTVQLNPFEVASVLVVLAALLGFVNYRFIGLPQTIGLTVTGAVASLALVALDALVLPGHELTSSLRSFVGEVDFSETLLDGLLSFLLFAGALHVDVGRLRTHGWSVLTLATVGVLLSTGLVAAVFFLVAQAVGAPLPFVWCLVFGALISPTDPVAVLGILSSARVPPALETKIAGESLFNDGIGVVLFTLVLGVAAGSETFDAANAARFFALEAGGGIGLGLALGWLAFVLLKQIDEHNLEILITIGVVMGGYTLAQALHVSGPLAMAVTGLLVGNHAVAEAMSDKTREHLLAFWSLLDELLNSILFLLIGIEVVAVAPDRRFLLLGLLAIPIVLGARAVSVGLPLLVLRRTQDFVAGTYPILVWGGLRGGISVALALLLPAGDTQAQLLTATYLVVLFSVVVQGSTVGFAARRLTRRAALEEAEAVTWPPST